MRTLFILMIGITFLLFACKRANPQKQKGYSAIQLDTALNIASVNSKIKFFAKINSTLTLPRHPIMGYRFKIKGDFDGDGSKEIYTEHFYSNRDKKEACKFYTNVYDHWEYIDSSYTRDCSSWMLCNNPSLDTINLWSVYGLLFIKNEGDLDGDGGDEISFVNSLPQQSSMNHCSIATFKNGKWYCIYGFEIREWQIPPLPGGGNTYSLFGVGGAYSNTNDSLDNLLLKQFKSFKGFIKKVKPGIIKVLTFNEDISLIYKKVNLTKYNKSTKQPL